MTETQTQAARGDRRHGRAAAGSRLELVRSALRPYVPDALAAAASAAIALIVALWVLHVWEGELYVPFFYQSDGLYHQMLVKGTLDHGWYLSNPSLGSPLGMQHHDFPLASNDSLQLLMTKALGLVLDSPFTVVNVYYLAGYPLCAATAFVVFRVLGISRAVAVVAGLLFALLPYHFIRGEDHLFLSNYFAVPLGCYLVLAVLGGRRLFSRSARGRRGPLGWVTPRSVTTLVICAVIASAGIYYAAFTLVLVAAAALIRAIGTREWKPLFASAVVVAALGTVVTLNQLPTIVYRLDNGPNPAVAERQASESEYWGMKVIQLVFPIYGHRVQPLASLAERYESTTPVGGEKSGNLGLIGTIGLIWLLVVALASAAASGGRRIGADRDREAATASLLALLLGTVGGAGAVFAYLVSPQLRNWNRISTFIAFLALLGVALMLDRLRPRMGRHRVAFLAVLAAVLAIGALDQTSPAYAPDHRALKAAYASDAGFVHEMERRLPAGASVLQLPYVPYPEAPAVNGMLDYDLLRGYLHSNRLRFSYGAMRGRDADWHGRIADQPLEVVLAAAAAVGFDAVYVDRRGYTQPQILDGDLRRRLGVAPLESADGRLAFYDMRGFKADVARRLGPERLTALRSAALAPVRVGWDRGFYDEESAGSDRWRWAQARAKVTIDNPGDGPRSVRVTALAVGYADPPAELTVRFPDGATEQRPLVQEGRRFSRRFTVPPGRSEITLTTSGRPTPGAPGDPRRLYAQIRNAVLADGALCPAPIVTPKECVEGSRTQLP